MFLNYFALGVLIFVFLVLFYGIIAIHDIPYNMAKNATILMLMPFIRRVGLACLHSMQYGRSCGFGRRSTSLNGVGHAITHHVERKGPRPRDCRTGSAHHPVGKRLDGEKKTDNSTFPEI